MSDADWMDHALAAARAVRGTTTPNPAVGAVVVRDGVLLGRGATLPVGGAHAEVMALRNTRAAGHDPAGATMYVTLEPCCHWGRTPPCTNAILEAGIRRVVIGTVDPFPAVQGKGQSQLVEAGVEVRLGVREAECAAQILGFARATARGLPEVGLALGPVDSTERASWDACIVDASVCGEVAGAHRLVWLASAGVDAVPPALDARLHRILTAESGSDPRVEVLPRGAEGMAIESVLRAVVRAGLHRVLFEVDSRRSSALMASGFVDHLLGESGARQL